MGLLDLSTSIRWAIVLSAYLMSAFALGQPEEWDVYQESGSRVVLAIEKSDSDTAMFRTILRIFAHATIGNRLFVLAYPSIDTVATRGFECEEWTFSGIVSESLVFDVDAYSVYMSETDSMQGILLGMLDRAQVGSEDWGHRLAAVCNTSFADSNEVRHQTLFIPYQGGTYESVWYTPPQLWNKGAYLEFSYDHDFARLETTVR